MIDDHGRRMTDRMTSSERDQSFPDSEPRDAATIMLIDRAGVTPKVLLGRRHAGHKFMPGKFVFPGGRIEALIMRIIDLQLSFPAILLALVLSALLGQGKVQLVIALVTATAVMTPPRRGASRTRRGPPRGLRARAPPAPTAARTAP